MNKPLSLLLLGALFLCYSSLPATNIMEEDAYRASNLTSARTLSFVISNDFQSEYADVIKISFTAAVEALKNKTPIITSHNKYTVLDEMPLLEPSLYNFYNIGVDLKNNRGNPCYLFGEGPRLLRVEDIENLPQQVNWFLDSYAVGQYNEETYVTLRYTAFNNLHWLIADTIFPPSDSGSHRYWHTEASPVKDEVYRTVNFLLKKSQTSA